MSLTMERKITFLRKFNLLTPYTAEIRLVLKWNLGESLRWKGLRLRSVPPNVQGRSNQSDFTARKSRGLPVWSFAYAPILVCAVDCCWPSNTIVTCPGCTPPWNWLQSLCRHWLDCMDKQYIGIINYTYPEYQVTVMLHGKEEDVNWQEMDVLLWAVFYRDAKK